MVGKAHISRGLPALPYSRPIATGKDLLHQELQSGRSVGWGRSSEDIRSPDLRLARIRAKPILRDTLPHPSGANSSRQSLRERQRLLQEERVKKRKQNGKGLPL